MKVKITFAYAVFCVLFAGGASLLQGCYEPPERQPMDADRAYSLIARQVRRMAGGLTADMSVIRELPLARKLYTFVNGGTSCSAGMIYDPVSGEPVGTGEETCVFEPGPDDLSIAFDETGENFLDLLEQYVFVGAQIESEGDGVSILLDPEVFCPMFSDGAREDGGDGFGETEGDTFCRGLLAAVQVRLDIYSYWADSIYVDVLVGDSRTFAAGFAFWGDSISVDIDLGYLATAMDIVNNLFVPEDGRLFDSLQAGGRLSAWVSRDYYGFHSLHAELYEGLDVTLNRPEGEYAAEADYSVINISSDADTGEFQVFVSIQDFDLSFPYQLFVDAYDGSSETTDDVEGSIYVRSDGLEFTAVGSLDDGTISVSQAGLGSGPFTVSRGFDTVFGVEFNPDDGHALDVVLSLDDAGRIVAALQEPFDLAIGWNLSALSADLDEIPAGRGDETWRILLDGIAPAVTVMDGVDDMWLRIDAGALTVSTTASPDAVVATAGQCIGATGDDSLPPLSNIFAGECSSAMH